MAPKYVPPKPSPPKPLLASTPTGPGVYDARAGVQFGAASSSSSIQEPTAATGIRRSRRSGGAGYPTSDSSASRGSDSEKGVDPLSLAVRLQTFGNSPVSSATAESLAAKSPASRDFFPDASTQSVKAGSSDHSHTAGSGPFVDQVHDMQGFDDLDCAALMEINKTNAAMSMKCPVWTVGVSIHQGRSMLPDGKTTFAASAVYFNPDGSWEMLYISDDTTSASDALRSLAAKSTNSLGVLYR